MYSAKEETGMGRPSRAANRRARRRSWRADFRLSAFRKALCVCERAGLGKEKGEEEQKEGEGAKRGAEKEEETEGPGVIFTDPGPCENSIRDRTGAGADDLPRRRGVLPGCRSPQQRCRRTF